MTSRRDLGGMLTRLGTGDRAAVATLRDLTVSDLTIVLTPLLDSRDDVDRVIAEVFATLRRRPDILDDQLDPLAALFALAHRTASAYLERQGKPPRPPEQVGPLFSDS